MNEITSLERCRQVSQQKVFKKRKSNYTRVRTTTLSNYENNCNVWLRGICIFFFFFLGQTEQMVSKTNGMPPCWERTDRENALFDFTTQDTTMHVNA